MNPGEKPFLFLDEIQNIDKWEKWTIICPEFPSGDVESGNIINLKSFHEKYLRARDYNEVNQADEAQDWEKWVITKD